MNAADKGQVDKLRKKEKFQRANEILDLKFLLTLPQGRRFIKGYLDYTKVDESAFTENTNLMYFLNGTKSVGEKMVRDAVEADLDLYLKMLKESKDGSAEDPKSEEKEET